MGNINRILVIAELNPELIASGMLGPPELGQEILAANFQIVLDSASAIFASGMAILGLSFAKTLTGRRISNLVQCPATILV
jgi:hypothetical protein